MRKPHKFNILSNKMCINCGQPLKKNLVDTHPDAIRCWVCYQIHIGSTRNNLMKLRKKQRKLIHKYK